MDEGEGGYGESGDPMDQFHRNEAISAVADEGFLGEEDDDYEDLYNDVNVGEGFLQSLRKNNDSGLRSDDIDDKKPPPPPPVPDAPGVPMPGVGTGGEGGVGVGSGVMESRVSGRVVVGSVGNEGLVRVEFYDPSAATACKEGMNGHVFNGRSCVVAFASPFTVKKMGEAQINRNQQMNPSAAPQGRRGPADAGAKPGGSNISTGGNYQGGDGNRGYGRGGNWGRGNNNAMGNRGPVNPMRNRGGGMGGRGIMGHGGNGFGQGMGGTPPLMGNYGGFPGAPTPPFSGILPSFPGVGGVGLPGVAPHVNPAFFGRGMPVNGMGMMPTSGMDGPNMGMWSDPNMGGWGGEEPGGDHQYGEVSHDRAGWPMREKDRGSERDWYADHHRYRDREAEHDDEWERGRSSRTHSKSRLSQEEEHHSRSRDADYGKRRRLTSE
uniref:RRM domain-containing protein n=1 Tax=Cajanus cajan TaxID=3821 RepID=A0A151S4Q8_CAJCA|nr:hypothetical protein KK1_028488 [Cajanus cajan]